jgi:hypothetical protein
MFTAALVLWCAGPAAAGEGTPAVIVHANGSCTSCEVMPMASTRMKLSTDHHLQRKPLPPINVTLCPGACFGYFPTQWRSWDDACGTTPSVPVPGYIPAFPPTSDVIPGKNGRAPDPRSADPMKMKSMIAPLHIPASRIN